MKIEIWSDIMCPFCYIGKRQLEAALASLPADMKIDIEWKSYQLNPAMPMEPTEDYYAYLMDKKGWTRDQVQQITAQITEMAAAVGLDYSLDKSVMVNSIYAHLLIQAAKKENKGDAAEEALFKAYFTEGKNLADEDTLASIAREIGLSNTNIQSIINDASNQSAFDADIQEASRLNITGVPFFVINRTHGISGAQPVQIFKQAIETAYAAWSATTGSLQQVSQGPSCDINGQCN